MKNLVLLQHSILTQNNIEEPNYQSHKLCIDSATYSTYMAQIHQDECRILRSTGGSIEFKTFTSFPVMNVEQPIFIVSFKYLTESESICICFSNGEIALIPESTPDLIDFVGSVESGILSLSWSPDEELFAAYTGEHKLLIMTKDFEYISENFVHVEEKGQEFYTNVGWGKKETQFHGTEGKQAAQIKQNTDNFNISNTDDGQPRLSWRGDGSYLTCSAIDLSRNLRFIRVYDREGILQNTSEPVDKLEHSLSWRPSGNLIASTQRLPHRYQVVFFERNGLRHGEFTLPTDIKQVVEMQWNCDSTVLALSVIKEIEECIFPYVQLWSMNNYFWYLKYEIPVCSSTLNFSDFIFDPENALSLTTLLSNGVLSKYEFCWSNYTSESMSKDSASLAASINGPSILLTPFRYRNIPPPMSAYQPKATNSVIHLAFSGEDSGNNFATLSSAQEVDLFTFSKGNIRCNLAPENLRSFKLTDTSEDFDIFYRQICYPTSGCIFALGFCSSLQKEILTKFSFDFSNNKVEKLSLILPEPMTHILLNPSIAFPVLQSNKGTLFEVQEHENQLKASFLMTLPESCHWIQLVYVDVKQTPIAVALSRRNKLYIDNVLVEMNCTSFYVHNEFVIYSTVEHLARFYPLNNGSMVQKEDIQFLESYSRNLERGSKIVLAVPHSVALVLQMPRGNLETVFPRTLVLASIRNSLNSQDYRSAFIACRKYRIDMNILYDENPLALMEDIELFVNQIPEPEHLNLFISGLKEENIASTKYPKLVEDKPMEYFTQKVNKVCSALRQVLLSKDESLYMQSIVTTYARQSPPDHESILTLLKNLKEHDLSLAEETLKYAIFLANLDHLFDVALGMYDFSLVLMVAQHSQKDPKEYLPFLSELQKLDESYRFFKIDDYLKKPESALKNLAQSGDDRFGECLNYIKEHELYTLALEIFSGNPENYKDVMVKYGNYLMEKKQYSDAGSAFISVDQYGKAIPAFIKTGNWQLALTCSKRMNYSSESTIELVEELCSVLKHSDRHVEAAKLLEKYKEDPEEIVACLIEGHQWLDAIFTCESNSRVDLIKTDVKPAVYMVLEQLKEDIQDMQDQFFKQRHRVQELLDKPAPNLEINDPSLDNVDVMSDATSAFTNFTVYTQALSQASSKSYGSNKTGRSRRKMERKKNQGKKGSVFEYEYLLGSVSRLVERANNMHVDVNKTLNALCVMKEISSAKSLQSQFEVFLLELEAHLDGVYKEPKVTGIEALISANKPGIEKVPKPTLSTSKKWKLSIL